MISADFAPSSVATRHLPHLGEGFKMRRVSFDLLSFGGKINVDLAHYEHAARCSLPQDVGITVALRPYQALAPLCFRTVGAEERGG